MIHISVSADNYEELKQKTLEVLGIKEPAQQRLPLHEDRLYSGGAGGGGTVEGAGGAFQRNNPHVTASTLPPAVVAPSLAALAEGAAPKKTKKAKAVAPVAASAEEEEVTPIEAPEVNEENFQEAAESEEDAPSEVGLIDCQTLLKRILTEVSTSAGVELLGKFGTKKLTQMDPTKFGAFYKAAEKVLGV